MTRFIAVVGESRGQDKPDYFRLYCLGRLQYPLITICRSRGTHSMVGSFARLVPGAQCSACTLL